MGFLFWGVLTYVKRQCEKPRPCLFDLAELCHAWNGHAMATLIFNREAELLIVPLQHRGHHEKALARWRSSASSSVPPAG
jgi:hypothetical protein